MATKTQKPLFISIEGGEGAGKGTQIKMLEAFLQQQNINYILTREPGGCAASEALRDLLLRGEDDNWDGLSEVLLHSAARNEHLRKIIRPALACGKWVISDRFADSTTVYQGNGRGIKRENLLAIHNLVVADTWPNLTIILDIDPEVGVKRSLANVDSGDINEETRYENLNIDFHKRVRAGFLKVAKENPKRCKVVDANATPDEVHAKIVKLLTAISK